MKYTTGKTLVKSITYEHLLEHTFCLFESGVVEANLVTSTAAFNLIHVISHMPECVPSTESVVLRFDEMIVFHYNPRDFLSSRSSNLSSISLMIPFIKIHEIAL